MSRLVENWVSVCIRIRSIEHDMAPDFFVSTSRDRYFLGTNTARISSQSLAEFGSRLDQDPLMACSTSILQSSESSESGGYDTDGVAIGIY